MGNYLFHAAMMTVCLALIAVKAVILFHLDSEALLGQLQYLDWGLAWLLPVLWLGERCCAKRRRTQNGVYLVTLRGQRPRHIRKVDPEEILEHARIRCKLREQLTWQAPFIGKMQLCYRKGNEWVEEEFPLSELKDSLDAAQRALQANGEEFRIFRSLPELLTWIDEKDFRNLPEIQRYFSRSMTSSPR